MQNLSEEILETISDMDEHFSPSAVDCIKKIWIPRIKQLEMENEVIKLCNSALGGDNKRLEADSAAWETLYYEQCNIHKIVCEKFEAELEKWEQLYGEFPGGPAVNYSQFEAELEGCRKLAHSYITAYEDLIEKLQAEHLAQKEDDWSIGVGMIP